MFFRFLCLFFTFSYLSLFSQEYIDFCGESVLEKDIPELTIIYDHHDSTKIKSIVSNIYQNIVSQSKGLAFVEGVEKDNEAFLFDYAYSDFKKFFLTKNYNTFGLETSYSYQLGEILMLFTNIAQLNINSIENSKNLNPKLIFNDASTLQLKIIKAFIAIHSLASYKSLLTKKPGNQKHLNNFLKQVTEAVNDEKLSSFEINEKSKNILTNIKKNFPSKQLFIFIKQWAYNFIKHLEPYANQKKFMDTYEKIILDSCLLSENQFSFLEQNNIHFLKEVDILISNLEKFNNLTVQTLNSDIHALQFVKRYLQSGVLFYRDGIFINHFFTQMCYHFQNMDRQEVTGFYIRLGELHATVLKGKIDKFGVYPKNKINIIKIK